MKKFLLMVAAVAALVVTAQPAAAQNPAQAAQAGGCAQCGDPGSSGYGYGGMMSKGKSFGGGWFGGKLHGLFTNHHGNGGSPQTLPVATGGQLVFPQNPFIRGPRDYFMWDEK